MQLWNKVIIGLLGGVIFGVIFPHYASYIKPIGDIFLRLLKIMIPPLIFCSLIGGITSVSQLNTLGRLGTKATLGFLSTAIFASFLGVCFGVILEPGIGTTILSNNSYTNASASDFNFMEFLINIIPNNLITPISENNILQIVFLAIFIGISINTLPLEVANNFKHLFDILTKLVMKMMNMIVNISPYAGFSLMAWVIANQGIGILLSLSKLVITISLAMLGQYIIFGIMIISIAKISPIPFYKKSLEYQLLAIATSSSKASLGTTMNVCRENLGISKVSTNFVLPLGASINMDGAAINLSIAAIFFAQMFGISLELYQYVIIMITSTLGSIGGAGIPGGLLMTITIVLSSVNIPLEGVAILAGIDRILDMLRTAINITGDATVTLIVDRSENTLDMQKYNSYENFR